MSFLDTIFNLFSTRRGAEVDKFDLLQEGLRQARQGAGQVVLLSLYQYPASVIANAHVGNILADQSNSRLAYYTFDEAPNRQLEARYRAFGANCELTRADRDKYNDLASKEAFALLQNVKTKWDVFNLRYRGVFIGDLVYDSYLRYRNKATIHLEDPHFSNILTEAICNFIVLDRYFSENQVTAAIVDHLYYISGGIAARVAYKHGVPLLNYGFTTPFYLYRAPLITAHDGSCVPCANDIENYQNFFNILDPEEQDKFRKIGRVQLLETLDGGGEFLMYESISAFGLPSAERLLPLTGKPRVLVMLHEFCDAPNCLGKLLFPDFYEWIFYLLEKAARTDFEWIIKPHACLQTKERSAMNEENFRVVEEIRRKFPQFTVLSPAASNKQILAEGISSMFTVRGSSGYEFAYLGIPVVAAGKSFYSEYSFVHQAKSLEEFDAFIANADRLTCPADKRDIESFHYVYRNHLTDHAHIGEDIFPEAIIKDPDYKALLGRQELFAAYAQTWSEEFYQKSSAAIRNGLLRELPQLRNDQSPQPSLHHA